MLSDIKKSYFEDFGIDLEKAKQKSKFKDENGVITKATEMLGEKIIKKYQLFDLKFADNLGFKKECNPTYQRSGIDYWIFGKDGNKITVDVKTNVGTNYYMKQDDYNSKEDILKGDIKGIPLEIYQYNEFTHPRNKLTNWLLNIVCDTDGIWVKWLDYATVSSVCYDHTRRYKVHEGKVGIYNDGTYSWHISNNNSGIYIKYPVKEDMYLVKY